VVIERAGLLLGAGLFILTACSGADDIASPEGDSAGADVTSPTTPTTDATDTTTTTIDPPPTTEPETQCVVTVVAGDSLARIAGHTDELTVEDLQEENRLGNSEVIHPGDQLDICIGNELDDVTGASRLPPSPAAVRRQQEQLNELFAPYTIADLAIDGDSGPLTRQMLCAARLGLGLRVDTVDMSEGSPEEISLFEAESLSVPKGAATWVNQWILIDETCQVVFIGEGDGGISNVFPTSTGQDGFGTYNVQAAAAFRYDPALDTNGWHDSSLFPVAIDNPLNGNMYKPLYFNGGQAIHGANYVPPEPRSKGCARLFPWHQDLLLSWLGLDDVTEPTWREDKIGLTVTVQGEYRPTS